MDEKYYAIGSFVLYGLFLFVLWLLKRRKKKHEKDSFEKFKS